MDLPATLLGRLEHLRSRYLSLLTIAFTAGLGLCAFTGFASAADNIWPGGPPLCAAEPGDKGGDQAAIDVVGRVLRARADGKVGQTITSFAEAEYRFTPLIGFPATLKLSTLFNGLLVGTGGGDLNFGAFEIKAELRDVATDTVLDSKVLHKEKEKGKPLQKIFNVVGNPFSPPTAEFNADLKQGTEFAVRIRLETSAKGGLGAESDFFTGSRRATFSCLAITPNLVDTDGDTLYDSWETSGIDIDGDGEVDLKSNQLGTDYDDNAITLDPNRKDVLVEIDYFNCAEVGGDCAAGDTHSHEPMPAALDVAVQAFDNAPVDNPGGAADGINLWVQVDEALFHRQNCDLDNICFDPIKADKFGTVAERANPKTIAAKRLLFRYNLWVHDKNPGNTSSGEADGSAGVTGDDFIVSLGSWSGNTDDQDDQTGTFMHELGHTMALGHGGGDNVNCKPNYLSVMSYAFQVTGLQPTGAFDLSRSALPGGGPLKEDTLDETIGIADGAFVTFYGPPVNLDGIDQRGDGNLADDWLMGAGSGNINWDNNGANTDNPATPTDINFLGIEGCGLDENGAGAPDPAPSETLAGFVDWDIIRFDFRNSELYTEGAHAPPEVEELDRETADRIKENQWWAQIDKLYEYSAKFICGIQKDPEELRLAVGRYATIVNIHNPNRKRVTFRKKLALAFPPVEQRPGPIIPISLDKLNYDEALKVDCEDIRKRLFNGQFPAGYIDGFLVVQSPESLDVAGVYTTATLGIGDVPSNHSSIHIDRVPERIIDLRLPDLIIDERFDNTIDCQGSSLNQKCEAKINYGVRNIGNAPAGPFKVQIVRKQDETVLAEVSVDGGLDPGELFTDARGFELTADATDPESKRICIRADAPISQVTEKKEDNNDRCFF